MKEEKSPRHYLIAAILWTVLALFAGTLLLFYTGGLFAKLCCILLICMCLVGQWMRYFKSR